MARLTRLSRSIEGSVAVVTGAASGMGRATARLFAAIEAAGFEASWDTSIAVMATAQAWAIRCALPALRQSANPRIVNVASTEALGATAHNGSYIVAKHASVGLTRARAG